VTEQVYDGSYEYAQYTPFTETVPEDKVSLDTFKYVASLVGGQAGGRMRGGPGSTLSTGQAARLHAWVGLCVVAALACLSAWMTGSWATWEALPAGLTSGSNPHMAAVGLLLAPGGDRWSVLRPGKHPSSKSVAVHWLT